MPSNSSRSAAAQGRSQARPLTYGPRSITGAITEWPCQTNLTGVPQGSVLLATPIVLGRRIWPQAVCRPHIVLPPYQLAPAMRYGVKESSASLKALAAVAVTPSALAASSALTGMALAAPPVAAWAPGEIAKASTARAPASSATRSQSAV